MAEKERFVLAFRRSKVLVLVCALLNASVTAKNNSQDCFLYAFVRISPTYKPISKIKGCPIGHPLILAEKERFVLAFRRSKVLVLVSALLNASVTAKNNS